MQLTDILAFACGSLVGTMICSVIYMRSMRKMGRLIHHLRRNSYLRGWHDGTNARWKPNA